MGYKPQIKKLDNNGLTQVEVQALIDSTPSDIPDTALTVDTIRMCDWSFGSYDTSVWNLGTGGTAKIKWHRVGRIVEGWMRVAIASDATVPSGYLIVVHPDDLPYVAKVEAPGTGGFSQPGGFGALYKAESSGGAADGYKVGLACVTQDTIGSGISTICFFKTASETGIAAGLDNLWSPISNQPVAPALLPGATYFGYFKYEAAAAV